jgi:peptidoglycan/LPS O-acetylase OafA/YrhL
MEKIYLPGLNGIRAIAASIVVVFHTEQYSKLFGLKSLGFGENGMAYLAVDMFFVLSGYLITYLLLTEKQVFGKVELKKFYIRRILRIWPIYYITLILTGILYYYNFLEGNENIPATFILFSLFLPNVAHVLKWEFVTIFPLWSVGVEEQFYSFWPVLINKSKNVLKTLIILVVGYLVVRFSLKFFTSFDFQTFFLYSSFDALGIGGIAAWLVYNNHRFLKIFFHPLVQIGSWCFLVISIFYSPIHIINFTDNPMHALVYAILIINVSANPNTYITLENKIFNFLGKISYGMYVYNMLLIFLAGYFMKDILTTIDSDLNKYLLMYSVVIILTVLISYLSFYFLEARVLRLKSKYSNIHSTNSKTKSENDVIKEEVLDFAKS